MNQFFNILPSAEIESRSFARSYSRLIRNKFRDSAKLKFGAAAPITTALDDRSEDEFCRLWGETLLWGTDEFEGTIFFHVRQGRGAIFASGADCSSKLCREFTVETATLFGAEFGQAHLLVEREAELGRKADVVFTTDRRTGARMLSITAYTLASYVPDLYWLTILGPPYVRELGFDHIMGAPVFDAREIKPETIALQLTPQIDDIQNDFDGFASVRLKAKEHLGSELFFDPEKGRNGRYRVPDEVRSAVSSRAS